MSPDSSPDRSWVYRDDGQRQHDYLVGVLQSFGWRTNGLRRALRVLAEKEASESDVPLEDTEWFALAAELTWANIIPDAWRILEEGVDQGWGYPVSVLEVAEVVVTHGLDEHKRGAYARMWMLADSCDTIAFRLIGYDVHGHRAVMLGGEQDVARSEAA